MSTSELRSNLHTLIDSIKDSETLKAIFVLLSKDKTSTSVDFWDELSDEERMAIEEGIEQADKGKTVSLTDVVAEGRAIYKKK